MKLAIISSSVRTGRNSHRVALFLKNYIETKALGTVEILDLTAYQFPLFEERLKYLQTPAQTTLDFAGKIQAAEGVIIVTPEYNGGYPASLKNVIDLLTDEWKRKPVAIATVSTGNFAGMNVITALQFTLWKIQAWTVPALFPVSKVEEAFNELGTPSDKAAYEKRAKVFLDELAWCIEAKRRMMS